MVKKINKYSNRIELKPKHQFEDSSISIHLVILSCCQISKVPKEIRMILIVHCCQFHIREHEHNFGTVLKIHGNLHEL